MFIKIKGSLLVFLSALLYGSYGVWAVLLGSEFGNFFQAYVRAILVLAILVPVCLYTKNWTSMKLSDLKHFVWCCGFLLFSQAPIYYAYRHAGVGITSLIFFGSYLIAAYTVGYLLLKEKMTRVKILSFFLALMGLYLAFAGSLGALNLLALLMAAVSGVSGGGGMSATKMIPKRFSSIQILIITWGMSAIIHLPISLLLREKQLVPTLNFHWLALIGFAVAGILGSWFLVEGLKTIGASLGGLISILEVAFAILFGYLFFAEKLHFYTLLGALLILIAAAAPQAYEIVKNRFLTA